MFSFPLHFHLFRGTGLTNRNFTHLVKVLWSHQGVGIAISQTSTSFSPVVLALWDPRMKNCSWHSCSSTELKENLSPESLPWSPNPTACADMAETWGGEGIAGTKLFLDCRSYLHSLSWALCPTHAVSVHGAAISFHVCSLPLPSQRKAGLVINANL